MFNTLAVSDITQSALVSPTVGSLTSVMYYLNYITTYHIALFNHLCYTT